MNKSQLNFGNYTSKKLLSCRRQMDYTYNESESEKERERERER